MESEVLQDLVWIRCCISALYKCVAEDGLFALFVNVNSSQGQRYIERYLIYHIKVFFCSTMACVLETNPAGHCLPPAHSSQEPGQEAALMPISSFYICSPKTVMGSCHAKRQLRLFCLQARASPCLKLSVCHGVHSVRHCSSIQTHSALGELTNSMCDSQCVRNGAIPTEWGQTQGHSEQAIQVRQIKEKVTLIKGLPETKYDFCAVDILLFQLKHIGCLSAVSPSPLYMIYGINSR